MSMLIKAKQIVNVFITNAETQYLGAEPGEFESFPNVCSLAPLCMNWATWIHSGGSSLTDPRYMYIIFYSVLWMCPKRFVLSGTGGLWLRQDLELWVFQIPAPFLDPSFLLCSRNRCLFPKGANTTVSSYSVELHFQQADGSDGQKYSLPSTSPVQNVGQVCKWAESDLIWCRMLGRWKLFFRKDWWLELQERYRLWLSLIRRANKIRSSSLYSAWLRPIHLTLAFHELQIHSTNLKPLSRAGVGLDTEEPELWAVINNLIVSS